MKIVITILAIALVGFSAFLISRPSYESRFHALLSYETQNRLYAHATTGHFADKESDKTYQAFWIAYHRMENHSQSLYPTILEANGIENVPDWLTRLKIWTGRLGFPKFLRDFGLSIMRDAAVSYVLKLKEMQTLAPEKDAAFFRYVVDQEQVQADALTLVVEGKVDEATLLIEEFVDQQVSSSLK